MMVEAGPSLPTRELRQTSPRERYSRRLRFGGGGSERNGALAAELESRRILEVAFWTDQQERRGSLSAEFRSLRISKPLFEQRMKFTLIGFQRHCWVLPN
jgi:hypothetical protein